jgi:hypothetical protein
MQSPYAAVIEIGSCGVFSVSTLVHLSLVSAMRLVWLVLCAEFVELRLAYVYLCARELSKGAADAIERLLAC